MEHHSDLWSLLLHDKYRAKLSPVGLVGTGGEREGGKKGPFYKEYFLLDKEEALLSGLVS